MNVVYALVGSAVGAPIGLWGHAWFCARRDVRQWKSILSAYTEGEE